MFPRKRSDYLFGIFQCIRKWIDIAKIMVHHSAFSATILRRPDTHPSKPSQNTIVSDDIRFSLTAKSPQTEGVHKITSSPRNSSQLLSFSCLSTRQCGSKNTNLISHTFQNRFYIMNIGLNSPYFTSKITHEKDFLLIIKHKSDFIFSCVNTILCLSFFSGFSTFGVYFSSENSFHHIVELSSNRSSSLFTQIQCLFYKGNQTSLFVTNHR